jgi:dicarboxylate/amino acid:cation (Na+ or H+) symporter, DAACS family
MSADSHAHGADMASSPVSQTRVLIGLVTGAIVGSLVNFAVTDGGFQAYKPAVEWVIRNLAKPVGDIFLNLLFLAIIPLVFSSLVVGVTRLGGTSNVGRIGLKTLAYFIITTACAAVIGLTMVNAIRPGERLPEEKRLELKDKYSQQTDSKDVKKAEFGINTFVNIVPRNPFKAMVEKDMLAIIFVAILVGIALTRIDADKAELITRFLQGINQITDFVIRLAMSLAPYAVFALIFATTAELGYEILLALGAFVLTVLAGLAIHQFVILPILVQTLGGMNPLVFFQKIRVVMITAFSTSSSSATLPTAMQCAENELGVPERISKFVLPLSASMNHNGTALFEGVTVIFLAQIFNVDLSLGQQLIVLVLCILTATGMAGVPGGSLPLIGIILTTASEGKVPAGAIAMIFGVDRFLDMCRTTVNVTADMTTALYVARSESRRGEKPVADTRGSEKPL